MSSAISISALAASIFSNARLLHSVDPQSPKSEAQNSCEDLTKAGASTRLPTSTPTARETIFKSCQELMQLIIEPDEYLEQHQIHYQHFACLRWLLHFNIFDHISSKNPTSYATIATSANVPLERLKSVVRMAITDGLLSEPIPDHLTHSRISSQLVENPALLDWGTFITEYSAPTAACFTEATAKWGNTSAKNQTAYNIAFRTDLPFFQHLAQSEEMEKRFAGYMRSQQHNKGLSNKHILDIYDWSSLGNAHIVDVGGSTGHASLVLAENFPGLTFTVQDLPGTITASKVLKGSLKENISMRITFQEHDFLTAQPVTDADVYFLRKIIHDWPSEDAKTILQHLANVLKPGAVIIIMDTVLPPAGSIFSGEEAILRLRDLTMAQSFNSGERELTDWMALIESTVPKLRLKSVRRPSGSVMAALTVQRDNEPLII